MTQDKGEMLIRADNRDKDVKAAIITMLGVIKENVAIMTGLLESISRKVKTVKRKNEILQVKSATGNETG